MISIQKKKHLLSRKKGGVSMEILKLLLNNSDTIIIGMLTCYLYDKIKNHSNGNKSDL